MSTGDQSTARGRLSSLLAVETRERYTVNGEKITVGRADDNAICLKDDVYVSSHHAEIEFHDDEWWLTDLGSRNGTLKNSQPVVEPVTIEPGDVITFGRTKFSVE